jgi:hypothetical protein
MEDTCINCGGCADTWSCIACEGPMCDDCVEICTMCDRCQVAFNDDE